MTLAQPLHQHSGRCRSTCSRSTALMAAALAALLASACSRPSHPSEFDVVSANLTAEQCEFFAVNGKVTICHATSSKKNPYVIHRPAAEGCINGHADHAGDFISLDNKTCNGQGCFPLGAPNDPDHPVACCEGLEYDASGHCAPVAVDLCANITCNALDVCHEAGVCDPATGGCSNPELSCDDLDPTTSDSCELPSPFPFPFGTPGGCVHTAPPPPPPDPTNWNFNVGGSNAGISAYPWIGSLILQGDGGSTVRCTIVLLNSTYALTTSRCVDGILPSTLTAKFGTNDREGLAGTQTVAISSYTMHEAYKAGVYTYSNDIAILNLASPVTIGGNIQPATLPADNSNVYAGIAMTSAGWGRFSPSSPNLPIILQKTTSGAISTAACQSRMDSLGDIHVWDNQICMYDPTAETISGGVLHYQAENDVVRVSGINSFTIQDASGAGLANYPQVFTNVGPYLDWITANTP